MAYENVLLQRDGAVATITINRPKALNALNPATVDELRRCGDEIRQDRAVHCVVITGAGEKAFVAGADIAAMVEMSPIQAREFSRQGQQLMSALEALPIPVIAAVNGFALGGGLELALSCDLILAAQSAKFGQPEINLGIIPGFGGTQRLTRRIGIAAARLMIYSGDMINADEALRLGLVNRVLPAGELMAEAQKLATTLATKAPIALQQAKAAINVGSDIDLQDGCDYESQAFAVTFGTEDRTEGMRAFLEKRRAGFKGV